MVGIFNNIYTLKKVSAAVVIENQKVLLTRRNPNDNLAGYWEFPGGKVENGETPQECLVRELKEELGVLSTAENIFCESIYRYKHGEFKILAIHTRLHSKDFKLSSHDMTDWVDLDKLLNYKLLPADIPIALKIIESVKYNEFLQ